MAARTPRDIPKLTFPPSRFHRRSFVPSYRKGILEFFQETSSRRKLPGDIYPGDVRGISVVKAGRFGPIGKSQYLLGASWTVVCGCIARAHDATETKEERKDLVIAMRTEQERMGVYL